MATLPYTPYQAPVTPGRTVAYREESKDPRKLVANTRALTQETGDNLMSQDQQLANQYFQQASGTQSYLNDLENPLAAGQGGYSGTESSDINLSPEARAQIQLSDQDKQNIVTGAGISAGAGTASAVGAAERAAAATGGNPAALATYRARAAQTQGAQAGDAMTQARIAAQQAGSQGAQAAQQLGSQGAQAVGNARIGQQNQALSYYNGLQGQQNTSGQNEQGLQQGAYGTQTSGTTSDAATGVKAQEVANSTPSTFDKVLGGVGALAGGFAKTAAADGMTGYLDEGTDAVVGEDGPEAIVGAASDPVRSHTTFMDDGTVGGTPPPADPSLMQRATGALQTYLNNPSKAAAPDADQSRSGGGWNKATPYQQLGAGLGKLLRGQQDASSGSGGQLPAGQTMNVPHMSGMGSGNFSEVPADLGSSAPDIAGDISAPAAEGLDAGLGGIEALASGRMGGYRAMANGGYGSGNFGVPHPPRIISTPTHVHLNKGDTVVPLSYRPQAKVRPSFALNAALNPARHPYGARRGA